MRLVCPKCSSQYEVDISLFPDDGREVQCSNCEEIWFQYPAEDEKPLRLDAPAVTEPAEDVRPTRPSQRLRDDEQRELAAAVQEEIAARDARPESSAGRMGSRRKIERREETPADDEILSALREQIEKEGGDFEGDAPSKSQKRDLAKAAESAGIAVSDSEQPSDRRWNVALDDHDDQANAARGRRRGGGKNTRQNNKRAQKDGLAAALRDLEASEQHRGITLRHGFATAVLIAVIGGGIYMFQDNIARAYPPAAPWLDRYDQLVIQGRSGAETLHAEYRPQVEGLIDRAGAMIRALTSEGEAAPE